MHYGISMKEFKTLDFLSDREIGRNISEDKTTFNLKKSLSIVHLNGICEFLAQHSVDIPLTTLNLAGCNLTDEHVKIIANFLKKNPGITALDLSNNNISNVGAQELAANNTLLSLNLAKNNIGNSGALALAKNQKISNLNLSYNHIGDAGIKGIVDEGLKKNNIITTLDLSGNDISSTGAEYLFRSTIITSLNISNNGLPNLDAKCFDNKSITHLDLSYNHIDEEGAIRIAQSSVITHLNLGSNYIKDKGAISLADNNSITHLNVSHNKIRDKGAIFLSKNDKLITVDVSHNPLTFKGVQALKNSKIKVEMDSMLSRAVDPAQIPETPVEVAQQEFTLLLEKFNKVLKELDTKSSKGNLEKYFKVKQVMGDLNRRLSEAGKEFFASSPTQEGFDKLQRNCNAIMDEAEINLKKNRGTWNKMNPILKGILGFLASVTLIPGLLIAATSKRVEKHGYVNTFFGPPVENSQQKALSEAKKELSEQTVNLTSLIKPK